jgi:hypothetical protein
MYILKKGAAGFLKIMVTECIVIFEKITPSKKLNMTSERFELRLFVCTDRKC